MEAVLRDLYRKKESQMDRTDVALELLEQKIAARALSLRKKLSGPPKPDPVISKRNMFKWGKPPSTKVVDKRIQTFGSDASQIPGFEDLAQSRNSAETVCWLLILMILIGLTVYSFVLLVMDYMENPTRTNVAMLHSPVTVPAVTLCVPLHIDKTRYVKAKNSAFENFSWKQTAHTLRTLLATEQNLTFMFQCQHYGDEDVQVRLINEKGRQNNEYGRVEIKLNEPVDNPQDDCLSKNATTLHPIQSGQVPDVVWMDNVGCTGAEQNLGHCRHRGWGDSDCIQSEYAAVDCTGTANPDPWKEDAAEQTNNTINADIRKPDIDVRLRKDNGAATKKVGTVEVLFHGVWGTISDGLWGKTEAVVVCRMLGWPEGTGTAYSGSGSGGYRPTWLRNVQCSGNETSLSECNYEITSRRYSDKAAVDCTSKAERNIRLSHSMRSLSFGRTISALLARLTALETLKINSGETPASFKWSTSPQYTAGNFDKEMAIETLLTIMSKSGHPRDLRLIREVFACAMCRALALNVHLQLDKFSKKKQRMFDCDEVAISWIEDSISARTVCLQLPLAQKMADMHKGIFALSLDIGQFYDNDWSNRTVREFYANNFKIDFSDSINAEKETAQTLELSPGEEQTVTIDTVATYNMEEETDCDPDPINSELKCFAMEYQKPCAHLCTPFTWDNLTRADQPAPRKPYCLLKDYRQCYQRHADAASIQLKCLELCKQACHHKTFSVRTLFKSELNYLPIATTDSLSSFCLLEEQLPGQSETKLFVKLNTKVYPKFTENRAVTWYGLVGDLGGVLGLWLGASLTGVLHFGWFLLYDVLWTKRKVKKQMEENVAAAQMQENVTTVQETELNEETKK